MRSSHVAGAVVALAVVAAHVPAFAQPAGTLTADRAVQIALRESPQVVQARAAEIDARSGLNSAFSGVLPHVSVAYGRTDTWTKSTAGQRLVAGVPFAVSAATEHDYSTAPSVTGTWNVLDFSNLVGVSSAHQALRGARLGRDATANDVALSVRRQFYTVVQAYHLARVNGEALRLSRDSERRVRALFEVGSVSRSDVLQAQVQTAQSQLDSLTAVNQIATQRNNLATLIGLAEDRLGDIDTSLVVPAAVDVNEGALLDEASRHRPDVLAAEANLKAASLGVTSAHFLRLPYVTVSATGDFSPRSTSRYTNDSVTVVSHSNLNHQYSATIALNLDVFSGLATEARIQSAQANELRARENRDALRRNLAGEVHQAVVDYREAQESEAVAQRALESGAENLNLTQQKYNVGSATILDLITAQVNLQRAENQEVSARASIQTAEAELRRVVGRVQ